MKKNQKINCNVESCEFNNCDCHECNLKEINVACECGCQNDNVKEQSEQYVAVLRKKKSKKGN